MEKGYRWFLRPAILYVGMIRYKSVGKKAICISLICFICVNRSVLPLQDIAEDYLRIIQILKKRSLKYSKFQAFIKRGTCDQNGIPQAS